MPAERDGSILHCIHLEGILKIFSLFKMNIIIIHNEQPRVTPIISDHLSESS
jgi:hypothetical protein